MNPISRSSRPRAAAPALAMLSLALLVLLAPASPARSDNEPVPAAGGIIVVLDPGHGGGDAGVKGAGGLTEKDLTLALAVRLKEMIERDLGLRVILTRSGDYEVPPIERSAMADNNKAFLFVSLHLGWSASGSADDFTAFYAEPRPARKEAAPPSGPSFWRAWNEQNDPYRADSRRLAEGFQLGLSSWLSKEATAPMGADLLVLKGVGCAAAMLELGCLSNLERERSWQEGPFQDELARVLFKAVSGFLGGIRG